jgi:hypothetical protein
MGSLCFLLLLAAWRAIICTSAFSTGLVHSRQQRLFTALHASSVVEQTKAGKRFDAMLADFRRHSSADINLVTSPRYRALLAGTSAAIHDEPVTEAFRVVYEDLGPVRVAGDLIFSKLERELVKSKTSDAAERVQALGRGDSCVVAARKIFDAVDADASGTARWDNVWTVPVKRRGTVSQWPYSWTKLTRHTRRARSTLTSF